jgi:ABC-2 type transport system permease protein
MWQMIKREVTALLRDPGSLFFCAVFPFLLTGLLGNLLQSMDVPDLKIDQITLQCVGIQQSALPDIDGVTFVQAADFEAGKAAVKAGEADAAVQFSAAGIELYNGRDAIKSRAIATIFRSVSIGAQTSETNYVKTKDLGYNRNMIDYYAVSMIVMILFMGSAISGAGSFYESRKDGTLRRQVICPKSRTGLYIGSILSFAPQNLIQVVCTMVPVVLLFGAHYANTFAGNALLFIMFFTAGFAISALFSLVGLLVPVNPTMVIMPVSWAMLFCSGTFSQSVLLSEWMPPYLIQTAAFDLTVFGRPGKALAVMGVSLIVLLVSTAVGAVLFNRKAVTER